MAAVPSLPPPRPKSPPQYPDLYGKRRELARVPMLEREIGFLEDELKFVDRLQPASRACKEVTDFVLANPDPLIPTVKKKSRSSRFWKWLCRSTCCSVSWICCCECPTVKMSSQCCDCDSCCGCPTCPKCTPTCPSCKLSCLSCTVPKCWSCCSCPSSQCCKKKKKKHSCSCKHDCNCGCDCCCAPKPKCPNCSCPKCDCDCCNCGSCLKSCCCPMKCPKVKCCSCTKNGCCCYCCCNPCFLCF